MDNWLALYIAIGWHIYISPEQSFRILYNKQNRPKRRRNLTSADITEVRIEITKKAINWMALERRYRIDRYEMVEQALR